MKMNRLCGVSFIALLLFGHALRAQTAASQSLQAASEQLQAKIAEVAHTLQSNPRLKKMSLQQRENMVQFITGNMLFVLLHELGHAAVDEFELYVLGREEDAADSFAVGRLLGLGSAFSHRMLVEAAKGWFYSDRRDRRDGEPLVFYDEHGLDKQRAYQIVCLMVGSNPREFKDLAKETKLPEDRQESCQRDFAEASKSWQVALERHLRGADQPKAKIDVVYGEGKGQFDAYAQAFHFVQMLETVAERATEVLSWPAAFTLEMQACGFINARWVQSTRKLTLCYELAADFAELYRDFGSVVTAANHKKKSKSK
jgi:Putative metallopeptidase